MLRALGVGAVAVAIWGVAARDAGAQDSTRLSAFARGKAEALLREKLPCLGCHRLGEDGGRVGPDLSEVGARRGVAYIAAIVADPQGVVPGTVMPRQAMPEGVRRLVVRYLGERRATTTGGPPPKDEGTAARATNRHPATAPRTQSPPPPFTPAAPADTPADALYARFCASCHGASGNGDGPNAPFLPVPPARHASRADMSTRSDDRLFDAIAAGGAPLDKSPRMPAFGETLTRDQIRRLVGHIRTLCRCEGPAWSAKSNAAGRAP